MMEKRNKLWRQQQCDRVYVAQLKWIATCYGSSLIDGKWVRHPCWKDLYDRNLYPEYKSVRTPCSCYLCRGERYNRLAAKKDTKRILQEAEEEQQ